MSNEKILRGSLFLGGEPLHQAENLWWLIKSLRARSNLTIFLFTGNEEAELKPLNHEDSVHELCDMVATGRYDQSQRNTQQQWIGSDNPKIIYYPAASRIKTTPPATNQIEIILTEDESIRVLGFPDDDILKQIVKL